MAGKNLTAAQINYIRQQTMQLKKQQLQAAAAAANADGASGSSTTTRTVAGKIIEYIQGCIC
jgi:hypothetical protein